MKHKSDILEKFEYFTDKIRKLRDDNFENGINEFQAQVKVNNNLALKAR